MSEVKLTQRQRNSLWVFVLPTLPLALFHCRGSRRYKKDLPSELMVEVVGIHIKQALQPGAPVFPAAREAEAGALLELQ